jgi:hypothetical protein
MEMEIDLDKKWKYLHFLKDDGRDGWSLGLSDEPSNIPRDKLLSIAEINGKVKRDETFGLVFNAIASDPQLIECADGLHEAVVLLGASSSTQRWKFFPVHLNRAVYRQFSNYVRHRRWCKAEQLVLATDMVWMNIPQLQIARYLLVELFKVEDLSEIDRLIVFKQENPAA